MHDFGVVEKTVPPKKPDQQPYNEVLKKNLKPSQINRLQKRASARAEQSKHKNESMGKSIQEANKAAADAANMKKTAEKALAEAEILKKEAEQVKAEGEKLVEEAEKAKSETESAKSKLNKSSFKNKCDHCDFKYNSTTDISMHINEVHIILDLFVLSMPKHNPFFSDIGHWDIIMMVRKCFVNSVELQTVHVNMSSILRSTTRETGLENMPTRIPSTISIVLYCLLK